MVKENFRSNMHTESQKNILIADDSVFFRIKLSSILEQAGHRVLQVKDGREVIDTIKDTADDIDLLVLDLQMPELDGFAVVDWLNENKQFSKFPIVVISGTYDVETIKNRLRGKNITVVISKDMSPDHIIYHINEALFEDESKKREHTRIPTTIPSDFMYEGRKGTGFLLSLSASGGFIHAREDFSIDKNIDLSFSIDEGKNLMEVQGLVKRATSKDKENTLFEGVGVTFVNLTEDEKKNLEEFIEKEFKKIEWYRDI